MLKPLVFLAALGLAFAAQAQQAGVVTHLSGTLSVKRADTAAKVLSVKSEVLEGDVLSTESGTYARVKFTDNSEVVLRPNTQLKIENYSYNQAAPEKDNVFLSMLKGGLRAVTGLIGKRNHEKIKFSTATATIGIRGTHWGMLLCQNDCGDVPTISGHAPPNGLHVDVADGAILVTNGAGRLELGPGQFGYVANDATSPVLVQPEEGVQVTMPPSISENRGSGESIGSGGHSACAL